MARAESWRIAARNIGSAYATAAKMHRDALAKQDKIDALTTQLIFSVLTVATSGALSWVSTGLQMSEKFPERVQLIEAVEDAAQAGVGEGFSALGPLIWTRQNESVNIEPQVFQNERENAVSEAIIKVEDRFGDIQSEYASFPLEKWDDYTEEKQLADFKAWLKEADTLAGKDDLPSIDVMADELERGIWALWVPRLRTKFIYDRLGSRIDKTERMSERVNAGELKEGYDYASVGSAIEERLNKLGILKMANVQIHWYQSADTEDKKLIAWAQGYKVKSFLSLKK